MGGKLFFIISSLAVVIIIIGLFFLFTKQKRIENADVKKEDKLEILGEKSSRLPSGLPTPQLSPTISKIITNPEDLLEEKDSSGPPDMTVDTEKKYTVVLETTAGNITILLYAKKTPITVNNFISLARKDYYNDTIFHRVIKGFMIQGGDPRGDGTGGPGYTIQDEPFEGEYLRGTVAMARTPAPNSAGSQFFIVHEDSESLAKDYVIFGEVTKGMDVVDTIADAPVVANRSGELSKPEKPVSILNVKITEE